MALTTKGRATRQRILEGTSAYLRGDSPGGVTLDDIRAITGTSKGQLFHYFPGGKDELLIAVAQLEADRVISDQQPHLGALTSWAAWQSWRDAVVARYQAQGQYCPLAILMTQVGVTPGTAEVAESLLRHWQGYLSRGITEMQATGAVDPKIDAERTAAAFVAGIQGGVQILRSAGNSGHLEAAIDTLIGYLQCSPRSPWSERRTGSASAR